jgi:hypothetical protein
LGVSYASVFEVLLVSLALVYYASDMPNGKSDLIDYCKGVVDDSPDYQGHDLRWSPPTSWRYARQFQLLQARQRIADAMSMRHKGGDVQAIEYVAQHTFGVTFVAMISHNTEGALYLALKREKGHENPFSTHQGHPGPPSLAS